MPHDIYFDASAVCGRPKIAGIRAFIIVEREERKSKCDKTKWRQQDQCHHTWHGIMCVWHQMFHLSSICHACTDAAADNGFWRSYLRTYNMNLGHLTSDQNDAMDLHLLCIRFGVLESLEYAFVELEKCIINVVLTCCCWVSSNPSGKSMQLVSSCWDREVTKCFAFITNLWLHTAIV